MQKKAIIILILFVTLFAVANTTQVTAQETDIPVIEEVSFTDGGSAEIDELELASPINIIPNELLVMIVCSDNAGDDTYFNDVSGWTKLGESGNSVCDSHIALYYQVANGSQVFTNVTGITTSNLLGWILRISGVDANDSIEASNFAASTATGTNPQIVPSITTLKDNCLILYGIAFDGGDGYPMSVVYPFVELADRTNTGTPTEAYVSGCFGYRNLPVKGVSGDAWVYTENVDGASYFQLAINGDILTTTTETTGFLYDLFFSTELWGYFGPLALVVVGFIVAKNEKGLGILFIIIESIAIWTYLQLVTGTPYYWWHIIILILGVILCTFQMWKR
jgi:hypothetical protein